MIGWDYIMYANNIAKAIIQRGQYVSELSQLAELRKFDVKFLQDNGCFYVDPLHYYNIMGADEAEASMVAFGEILVGAWIYPLRMHNIIVGWCAWFPEEREYTNLFFNGVDKKNFLYGLSAENYRQDKIIVVEGMTDQLRVNSLGLPFGTGLLGNRISPAARAIINRFKHKILIPDRDKTGMEALEIWQKQITGDKHIILLEDAKDIDQKIKEDPNQGPRFVQFVNSLFTPEAQFGMTHFF